MLSLFEHDWAPGSKEFTRYVLNRLMQISIEVEVADAAMIDYLSMLYERVLEDSRISKDERSLLCILDKLEEDVMFDKKVFGERALQILAFLEKDVLKNAVYHSWNNKEKRILGCIVRIRNTWFDAREEEVIRTRYETPGQIKKYLDDYVIGQEEAKRVVSTAVYRHGVRNSHRDMKFASNIVLLIGPSGCGKTEIMRRIREITEYPMVFTDVSSLGASQYRGRHKEDILISLWEKAGRNHALAEKGIIFMDEFDKLLLPAYSERGINLHDDVQSQLLTMLEGSDVELKVEGKNFTLNTGNILFVLAGAFQGIEEYIKKDKLNRMTEGGNIGFLGVPTSEMNLSITRESINHDVLMQYGMKRELAGRISSIAVLESLGKEELRKILTETKDNLLLRFANEIKVSCGADLIFTDGAVEAVIEKVQKDPIGARALHSIVHKAMRECLFRAPSVQGVSRIVIDEAVIWETGHPKYEEISKEEVWDEGTL